MLKARGSQEGSIVGFLNLAAIDGGSRIFGQVSAACLIGPFLNGRVTLLGPDFNAQE